jgi:polysaccharide export outer membrane protein
MYSLFSVCKKWCLTGMGLLFLAGMLGSCGDTRQLTYMQGKFDTAQLSKVDLKEPIIQNGDLLSITVYSDNPAATALFNQPQSGSPAGGSSSSAGGTSSMGSSTGTSGGSPGGGGYLVDENENIEFQQLGLLHVGGMVKSQLKDTLESRLKVYLKNPYCTIRFLNYRFTMLGEIAHPGVFNFPGDHINLLQALGLGGDMTFFGRRDNVLVIRETGGKREYARLDLTKPEVMISPFFNLRPNDVIYIEANRKKIAANDQVTVRNISIAATIASTIAIIYSIFKK